MRAHLALLMLLTLAACGGSSSDPDAAVSLDAPPAVVDAPAPVVDGSLADAAPPDAAPAPMQLYAHVDEQLFRVDTSTGALTLVGVTGVTFFTLVDAVYDPTDRVVRFVSDAYTAPKWSTIDLCTGAVTPGAAILQGAVAATEIEGVARDDAGTYFLSIDANGSNNFYCENVATLDPTSHVATPLAISADTLQDDLDQLEWADGILYGLDVHDAGSNGGIYAIDRTTGAATLATTTTNALRRIAYEPVSGRMLGTTNASPRQLVEVNLATGALTPIGDTHAAAEHAGLTMDMIFFAPEPDCTE